MPAPRQETKYYIIYPEKSQFIIIPIIKADEKKMREIHSNKLIIKKKKL